jgi:cystathionine beta-lyase
VYPALIPVNLLRGVPGFVSAVGEDGGVDLNDLLDSFDAVTLDGLRARTSAKWREYPPDVLPAYVAELDVPLAPGIRRALHDAVDRGDTGYAMPAGLPAAYAEFAASRLGWAVDPGDLGVVPDVMVGVAELLRAGTAPGARVVINPPVYPPFREVVEEVGRRVVEVPLRPAPDGWELDHDGLADAFAAGAQAYLLCSPHNPTGTVWSPIDLHRIAETAARYGVWVLADEIHAPLVLPGARHTPFLSVGAAAAEHGLALVSASKAWNLAGLKCALVAASSARTRELVASMPAEVPFRAGHFGTLAGAAAFRDDLPWLDALVIHLDRNRGLLAGMLAERIPEIDYRPPAASYLAWLDCRALELGPDPAQFFLERGRVALQRGPTFGRQGEGFARLNFGTSRALLTEVVDRMAKALGR